jgi:hypothetical protein
MNPTNHFHGCCGAASCGTCPSSGVARRSFLTGMGAAAALAVPLGASEKSTDPLRQQPIQMALRVQPVLLYSTPARRNVGSWRNWGGIQTEQDASAEKERIGKELSHMKTGANFPIEILPLVGVKDDATAAKVAAADHDVTLVYAAGADTKLIELLTPPSKYNLIFLRHRSGPVYLWYEITHPRYLRKTVDQYGQPGMDVDDVIVDSHAEILYRLRALAALKNTLGKRVVCLGGPSGWGAGGRKAPDLARERWKLDLKTVGYPELGERLKRARANEALVKKCNADADRYLKQKGTKLETGREFVERCFLLTEIFQDLLDEHKTDTMTIQACMGTVMTVTETTACLPLSLLNDKGYMAFCESDFVVIPSGILLHYISGTPVFLNDPTYPHDGIVTLAHCTAPRKMDGTNVEPARILTHFESDFGASPKVEMRKGAAVTNIVPDFDLKKWTGFSGEIVDVPFLPICRSQIDVSIKGDTKTLLKEMGGFHWMTSYGDHLKEVQYAVKKMGVDWAKV